MAAVPEGAAFRPLMTLYLTDKTPPEEVRTASSAPYLLKPCFGSLIQASPQRCRLLYDGTPSTLPAKVHAARGDKYARR